MQFLEQLGWLGYRLVQVAGAFPNSSRAWGRLWAQLVHAGVNSLPLVVVVGLFTGAIMSGQAALQFKDFGAVDLMGGQVTRILVREVGPVITALVLAGRLGASYSAEIGAMKLTEQVDALRSLSISPAAYLLAPRVYALTFALPFLVIFSNVAGIAGAYAVGALLLDLSPQTFFGSVVQFFTPADVWVGLGKSAVFGVIIAVVGGHLGLSAGASAQMLGRQTIVAFVTAAMGVLLADLLVGILQA